MIRKKLTVIGAMLSVVAMMQTAQAAFTDSLYNLANNLGPAGGTLSIGDKTFSGFSYLDSGLTGFNANNIQVTASIVGDVYYLTWGGNISLVSGGPATADLLLNYTVTANPGSIFMIDQYYAGSAQPAGGAFLAVDETVLAGNVVVANSHLQVGDLGDPFAEVGDNLFINPSQSVLHVTKDIGFGVVNGGFVTISEVSQSFHQVPEPTTVIAGALLLLPFGASTIRFIRKSRVV